MSHKQAKRKRHPFPHPESGEVVEIRSREVVVKDFSTWVDATFGDAANEGTQDKPVKTIQEAL
jgi:hypothetical protein